MQLCTPQQAAVRLRPFKLASGRQAAAQQLAMSRGAASIWRPAAKRRSRRSSCGERFRLVAQDWAGQVGSRAAAGSGKSPAKGGAFCSLGCTCSRHAAQAVLGCCKGAMHDHAGLEVMVGHESCLGEWRRAHCERGGQTLGYVCMCKANASKHGSRVRCQGRL